MTESPQYFPHTGIAQCFALRVIEQMKNQSSRRTLFKTECDSNVLCATKTTKAFMLSV